MVKLTGVTDLTTLDGKLRFSIVFEEIVDRWEGKGHMIKAYDDFLRVTSRSAPIAGQAFLDKGGSWSYKIGDYQGGITPEIRLDCPRPGDTFREYRVQSENIQEPRFRKFHKFLREQI